MKEIINSKGMIGFFIFVIAISFVSSNSINNMEENNMNGYTVVLNENL